MKIFFDHEKLNVYQEAIERIVSMLMGGIRRNSPNRLHEEPVNFKVGD